MEHTAATLSAELEATCQSLLDTITTIKKEDLDRVPFEGSWTAGQVLEHIEKAVTSDGLYGRSQKAYREPDTQIPLLKSIFLDLNPKYTSPDFIQPTETVHDKDKSIKALSTTFDKLKHAVTSLDLTEICTDVVLPGFELMTRYELICLMMYHTQRHTHQLKRIAEILRNGK